MARGASRPAIRLAWHSVVAVAGSAVLGFALVRAAFAGLQDPPAFGSLALHAGVAAVSSIVTWAALGRTWGLVVPAYLLDVDDVLSPGMDANYAFVHAIHRGEADRVAGHLDRLIGTGRGRAGGPDPARVRAQARRRLLVGGLAATAVAAVAVLAVVGAVTLPTADRALVVAVALAVEAAVLLLATGSVVAIWVGWYRTGRGAGEV